MKKPILYLLAGIIYVVLLFVLPDAMDISPMWIAIALMAVYFVAIYLIDKYVFGISSVDVLEDKILQKMKKEGYRCEKEEGVLTYTMKGQEYKSFFWLVEKDVFRTMIVEYCSIDDQWDKISVEGKAVLANYINGECYHTTFYSNEYGCTCQFTTFVKDPADFLKEAKMGCDIIGTAIYKAVEMLPDIKQHYLANGQEESIGFLSREKGQRE